MDYFTKFICLTTSTHIINEFYAKASVFVICLCIAHFASGQPGRPHPSAELAEKAIGYALSGDRKASDISQAAINALDSDAAKTDSALAYFAKGLALKRMGERAKAMDILTDAHTLSVEAADIKLQYRIKTQIGVMHRENRNFEQAQKQLDSALLAVGLFEDVMQEVVILSELGHLWFDQGRNARALGYYSKAKQTNESIGNIQLAAEIDRSIGSTYLKLGSLFKNINLQKANSYFEESYRYNLVSFKIFEKLGQEYGSCFCMVNLLESSLHLKKYQFADSIMKTAEHCFSIPDNHILLTLKMAQASLFENQGEFEPAAARLAEVLAFKYMMLAPTHYHEAYMRLGLLARKQGMYDSAYNATDNASRWFAEKELILQAFKGHHNLAVWFEQDGMIEKALQHSKEADALKNQLVAEADMETFDELRYRYETDLLHDKLHEAEENERLQRQRLLITLAASGTLLIILILALLLVLSRRKKTLLLKHLAEEKAAKSLEESKARKLAFEQIQTAHELAKQKAEADKLLSEKKEQELILNALRRTEVMNMQHRMKERLTPFLSKLNKRADRDTFERLLNDFRHEITDDPMSQFELVFKQAYGDFYAKLVETCPHLTRSEIQVAVMLRLNLTTKEIAHILNLTTATVERTRHQLRQKLGLQPNQQLAAWLIGLG